MEVGTGGNTQAYREMRTPPKIVTRLIERFTSHREGEIILGDMHEDYEERFNAYGKFRADVGYVSDFISLLVHRMLRKKKQSSGSNFFTMLINNYLKIAVRQIGRQKLHNTINIAGLAVGLAVTFIISLFVLQELRYDRFHEKSDRLYLLPMTWKFQSTELATSTTTPAAGPLMKELFEKEIENYVRTQHQNMTFNREQGAIVEVNIEAVDSSFLEVFTFPLILGNPKEALREPNSMVLTERAALKYFGEDWAKKDLLSQTLVEQSNRAYKITGVMKDPPVESTIRFDMLISMSSLPKREWEPSWNSSSLVTYVLLEPGASAEAIVADIPDRVAKKYSPEQNDHVALDLIPMTDVYLKNRKYSGMPGNSDIRYVYVFSTIAVLVLIIAIINYMNLSTARSMERAREVGVRKVVGAVRRELFWQFIGESILMSFASIVIALGLAYFLLPVFNNLAQRSLAIDFVQHPQWVAVLFASWLVISLLGGAYPAMVLSSFRPINVLKGKLGTIGTGAMLRKSLVVFQFAISILLIVCTLTINNQLTYMVNKKIGVDKEALLMVILDSAGRANLPTLRNEFEGISGVERTSASSASPVNSGGKTTVAGGDIGEKQLLLYNLGVGTDFVRTAGLEVVAGSELSPDVPNDSTWEFLLNESAVELFGWTNETAVGKTMNLWQTRGVVKGVVRDFHFLPLQSPIEPMLLHAGKHNRGFINKLLVRVEGDNFEGITSAMEERWRKVVPGSPLTFLFLEEHYKNNLYRAETRLSTIMNVFSGLAIFIAGLGLFGLASYTIMQRTKELGIRKVLGASLSALVISVSGSFLRLVVIAFVVAVPVSWLVMNTWLENFAYSVGFSWLIAVASGAIAAALAMGTVMYHALEAAGANPGQTLRSE